MLLVAPPPKLAPTLSSFGLGSFAIVANARASLFNILQYSTSYQVSETRKKGRLAGKGKMNLVQVQNAKISHRLLLKLAYSRRRGQVSEGPFSPCDDRSPCLLHCTLDAFRFFFKQQHTKQFTAYDPAKTF